MTSAQCSAGWRIGDIAPPQSLKPDVPATLEAICRKAMAVRPEDRYQSVRALEADIESWLADEPVQGVPEPLAPPARDLGAKAPDVSSASAAWRSSPWQWLRCWRRFCVNAARERAEARRRQADRAEPDCGGSQARG